MRYYTDIDNTKSFKIKLKPYLIQIIKEKQILTQEGIYKYLKNQLFKFKLVLCNKNCEPPVKKVIQSSNFQWVKYDNVYNIPVLHTIIDIDIEKYKLNPKSSTTFIIEKMDGMINDYYFESNEQLDNHSFKEDINSFLSLVK